MMMAHDSTPPRPELSSASLETLRSALQAFLADETDATVQPAIAAVAAEAREKQMHAEQLLVLLKDVWFALPHVESASPGEHQNKMLQRVVSLCIRAYYST